MSEPNEPMPEAPTPKKLPATDAPAPEVPDDAVVVELGAGAANGPVVIGGEGVEVDGVEVAPALDAPASGTPGAPVPGPAPLDAPPFDPAIGPFTFEPVPEMPEPTSTDPRERARQLLEWGGPVDVLLLGSGGREDALCEKLLDSERAGVVTVGPGNGGMIDRADGSFSFNIESARTVVGMAKRINAGLVVIGPEAPLVAGVADALRAEGFPVFGPSKAAAQMEGSKLFAKEVMQRAGVPTAQYRSFTAGERDEAEAYLRELGAPVVVKADGLAAGKGVIVAQTIDEALEGLAQCFDGAFGSAGETVVIEEFLQGPEVSMLALTDGETVVPLATSQDHKRALDGDEGPNTGGMGVYSPVPFITPEEQTSMESVMRRVVHQLAEDGTPYTGCLYGGFMLTKDGPKVLEFNARFGDPETQVVLPRMEADLIEAMLACEAGTLDQVQIGWSDTYALSVVLTSAGYPGEYETGKEITGIEEAEELPGVLVYHAGDKLVYDHEPQAPGEDPGEAHLLTSGGRVLDVTAVARTFERARELAYEAAERIDFEGKTYRHDIGERALRGRDAWEIEG